ncbi:MAG: biotin transporter BioY, partial [Pseudomonadota bacterium]
GPTAGFLVGFIACAAIVGEAADRGWGESLPKMATAMLVGAAAVFALGFLWLSTFIGAEKAFAAGVLPFVLGDVVKIALASGIVAAAWSLVRRA